MMYLSDAGLVQQLSRSKEMATDKYAPQYLNRDAIDWTAAAEGKVLAWDATLQKLVFVDQSGGGSGHPFVLTFSVLSNSVPVEAYETVRVGIGWASGALAVTAAGVILWSQNEEAEVTIVVRDAAAGDILAALSEVRSAGANSWFPELTIGESAGMLRPYVRPISVDIEISSGTLVAYHASIYVEGATE